MNRFYKMMAQISFIKRIFFYLITLFGFIVVIFFCLFFSLKTTYQDVKEEERRLKVSKVQKQDEIIVLNDLKENIDKLNEQLRIVSLKLPSKNDLSSLLSSINELAQNSNLVVENYSAKPEKDLGGVTEISMLFEIKGDFLQIQKFLAELGQIKRLIKVKLIGLSSSLSNKKDENFVNVECLITAYRVN